jgi:hypothetical protein
MTGKDDAASFWDRQNVLEMKQDYERTLEGLRLKRFKKVFDECRLTMDVRESFETAVRRLVEPDRMERAIDEFQRLAEINRVAPGEQVEMLLTFINDHGSPVAFEQLVQQVRRGKR